MNNSIKYRLKGILYALSKKGFPIKHNNELYKPFFIVGSGRCGTTLLRRILCAADGIHIPPENWALHITIRNFYQYHFYDDWDRFVDLTVGAHCYHTQGWFEQFPIDFVRRAKECDKEKQSLTWLIHNIYHYHATITNTTCNRWGDKTPLNVNHMDKILKVFPKAQFVHMLRDGIDVINSWQKKRGNYNDISAPADRWLSAINSVETFKKKHPDNIIEIRYEDLVKKPREKTDQICNFLNISFESEMLTVEGSTINNELKKFDHYRNALKPISDKSVGKGRKKLAKSQIRKLSDEFNQALINVGYEGIS